MPMELDNNYSTDISLADRNMWHNIISEFKDANLYQTWPYDVVKFGEKGVSSFVLKHGDSNVAASRVRIFQLPLVKAGIAYVYWGPIWQRPGAPSDPKVFRQVIRALRNEFSLRRGLVLRIYPIIYQSDNEVIKNILQEEGYKINEGFKKRTLLIDLNPPIEELRKSMAQKWRNCLNRAEKNGLEIIMGEEENLFDEISKIYMEMVDRKGLTEVSDVQYLKRVQKDLPPKFKLKVILCRMDGQLYSGGIFSAIGNTGLYLIGATSGIGMKANGSYLIQWTFLKWLKENGYQYYDLNGINPEINPGVYHFKSGLAGKLGIDVEMLGKYQVSDSQFSSFIVNFGEDLLPKIKRKIIIIKNYLRKNNH